MRVPLGWLEEFVAVDVPVDRLAELLDLSGTKVESMHKPSGDIAGVVVAEVIGIVPHPNADNLTLVDVSSGDGHTQRVVCGAQNFAVGDRVPLAQVGSHLPGMEITERKIRGEVSRGMLCSAAELGVSNDAAGILILPSGTAAGTDVSSVLGLHETVLELEITPNRPDCMSVLGVAREVATILGNELKMPDPELQETGSIVSPVKVDIQDPSGCPRYLARYIEDVKVGPSPAWVSSRLLSVGVRPISNVVDATNYVLFELGQPLHAFDAAKVHDQHVVVRRAKKGELLVTLDGQERRLHGDDVLIADLKKGLALAGVMGGGDSEVSAETTAVILESAHFHPAAIAFTSRRHGLRTEASARFERGSDPEIVALAAARAAGLIASLSGARVSETVTDVYPQPIERRTISLRPQRAGALLGAGIATRQQVEYLTALGLGVSEQGPTLEVEVPTFRPDLTREVDLIEEVGRLAGFERLPATLPPGRSGRLDREQSAERALRRMLAGIGLYEAWTSSFMSAADVERLGIASDAPAASMVRLSNPMSEEEPALRTTLLPGLLRAVALNERQGATGVPLFEIARVYEPSGQQLPREALVVGAALAGTKRPTGWDASEEAWSFFDAKGIVEALFAFLDVEGPRFTPVSGPPFHPTRAAEVTFREAIAGAVGELHPDALQRWGIERRVVVFELALAPLLAALPGKTKIEELSRFPSNFIDLALVVDEGVAAEDLEKIIHEAGGADLASLRLFDIYEGDQIPKGKKSLAFALELRRPDRTVTDAAAAEVRDRIVTALSDRLGAQLRG